jgi:hypothetical protein
MARPVLIVLAGVTARARARSAAISSRRPGSLVQPRHLRARAARDLIALLPDLAELRVYDNSATVGLGEPIPDPTLVLEMIDGEVSLPEADDPGALSRVPEWARPVVEAAFTSSRRRR